MPTTPNSSSSRVEINKFWIRSCRLFVRLAVVSGLFFSLLPAFNAHGAAPARTRQLLVVHYMPWFSSPPTSSSFGWHWTMNHFQPQKDPNLHNSTAGQPGRHAPYVASHY